LAVLIEKEAKNAKLVEKMNHLEAHLLKAIKTSEEGKADTLQLSDKLLYKEHEIQNAQ
jgi:hypothetical protein